MSTKNHNIIVFQQPELLKTVINKTESQILYEKFAKTASLKPHHFSSIMEMDELEISSDIKTTIPSIAIKNLLDYCTPIIRDIPNFNIKKKTVNIFKKADDTRISQDFVKKYYNVTMQMEQTKKCFLTIPQTNEEKIKNSLEFSIAMIPKHETFNIIGIFVPRILVKSVDTSFLNYYKHLTNTTILSTGKFGLSEFQSGRATQSRFSEINAKNIYNKNNIIWFDNDKDTLFKIQVINSYIKYANNYYNNNLQMVYNYLHNNSFNTYIKNQILLYNIFQTEFHKQIPPTKHDSLSQQFAAFINYKLSPHEYENNFVFTHRKIYDDFKKIKLLGINHPTSKNLFKKINTQYKYDTIISEYNTKKFKKKLEYAKLKAIAFKKFKVSDISHLSKPQMSIVMLEFHNMEKYYLSIGKITDDLKLVNSFYWAIDNGKPKLIDERWLELSKIINIPKTLESYTNMICDKKHKIPIICPHILYKAKLILQPAKNQIQQSGIIRQNLIKYYAMPVTSEGHFCKVCGELLAQTDEEEISKFIAGKRVSFVSEIDRLKTTIWKEVAYIITSFVKFKHAVNYKHIVNNITNTLRPEIGNIEIKLSKIKSNSKDSINELLSIYICAYTLALVSNMIIKNYGNITFSIKPTRSTGGSNSLYNPFEPPIDEKSPYIDTVDEKSPYVDTVYEKSPYVDTIDKTRYTKNVVGGKMQKSQIILQNVINNALFIVQKIKNVAINNSMSISSDSLKPILITAYKWSLKLQNVTDTKKSETDKLLAGSKQFETNTIYNYIKFILQLNGKPHKVFDVLGRTRKQFEDDFQSSNKNKKSQNDSTSLYATANESHQWGNTPEIKYKYDSFKFLIEYVKNKLYNVDAVPYSNILLEHKNKYKYLILEENKLHNLYHRSVMRPFNNIKSVNSMILKYNSFKPDMIKIDKYYDNNGKRHNFNIYVYQKANDNGDMKGAKKEFTLKDIKKIMDSDNIKNSMEFKRLFICDYRCSVCNVLMSQTKNINVINEIKKRDDVSVFYKYFENICPKGELHEFINQNNNEKSLNSNNQINQCVKCGLTKKMFDINDPKYYAKYCKFYQNMQKEKLNLEKIEISNIMKKYNELIKTPTFPDWKINNSTMLELSHVFHIKYNAWINLGLSTGLFYKLIENEKLNPSINLNLNSNTSTLRNIQLYSYFLYIVRQISVIKYYTNMEHLPYELKELLNKNKVTNLDKKIQINVKDVYIKYKYYSKALKPHIVSNFLLYSISKLIMDFHNNMKKIGMNTGYGLVKYILNKIIYMEKMASKPDLNKFKSSTILSTKSDNTSIDLPIDGDQVQTEYTDEPNDDKSLFDASDDEPDDNFSMNSMDIENDEEENLMGNPMGF
jgi:hypothetical protein